MLTQRDLAERWGITYDLVRQRKARGKLPEPDRMIGAQPVWYEETIEDMEDGYTEDANGSPRRT